MKIGQPSASSGLSTDTLTINVAGEHVIYSRTTMVPLSGIVVTMSQSGSASVSIASPQAAGPQSHIEMNAPFNCQVGDILQVVVSSSAPIDQPPNLIKTIINIVKTS